jgi:hypothetical protein
MDEITAKSAVVRFAEVSVADTGASMLAAFFSIPDPSTKAVVAVALKGCIASNLADATPSTLPNSTVSTSSLYSNKHIHVTS